MKHVFYIFGIILLFSFTGKEENKYNVNITANSQLFIKGTSNVNTFTCHYNQRMLAQKIPVEFRKSGTALIFKDVHMQLDNLGFDCGNRGINRDFHELLQTEAFPKIDFHLLEVDKSASKPQAYVAIKIAGKKKKYTFPVEVFENSKKIDGVLCLNITDFDLIPPRKMMGLIVVREDIEINFSFEIQVLNLP
ncbi:MAG TPA: YceI family protein [Flavobacteriaceae bacterium]|nr:YceI family protein [Flavobacteriaceae bacterium]